MCCARLELTIPCVVDEMDNHVDNAYAAWPERLFIIGADGTVAYAGAQGPWGFDPADIKRWLRKHIGAPREAT